MTHPAAIFKRLLTEPNALVAHDYNDREMATAYVATYGHLPSDRQDKFEMAHKMQGFLLDGKTIPLPEGMVLR
jgi:hypothetical protein